MDEFAVCGFGDLISIERLDCECEMTKKSRERESANIGIEQL